LGLGGPGRPVPSGRNRLGDAPVELFVAGLPDEEPLMGRERGGHVPLFQRHGDSLLEIGDGGRIAFEPTRSRAAKDLPVVLLGLHPASLLALASGDSSASGFYLPFMSSRRQDCLPAVTERNLPAGNPLDKCLISQLVAANSKWALRACGSQFSRSEVLNHEPAPGDPGWGGNRGA